MKQRAHNNHIHPALYAFYLQLKAELGAEIVHRRRRKSATCIEIIFHNNLFKSLTGRLNTLPEAEKCGYWVVSRLQTKRGHGIWHDHTVYQLYLTPVHPKKRHETRLAQEQLAQDITFEPISRSTRIRTHRTKKSSKICIYAKNVVPLHPILVSTVSSPPSGGMLAKRYSDRKA